MRLRPRCFQTRQLPVTGRSRLRLRAAGGGRAAGRRDLLRRDRSQQGHQSERVERPGDGRRGFASSLLCILQMRSGGRKKQVTCFTEPPGQAGAPGPAAAAAAPPQPGSRYPTKLPATALALAPKQLPSPGHEGLGGRPAGSPRRGWPGPRSAGPSSCRAGLTRRADPPAPPSRPRCRKPGAGAGAGAARLAAGAPPFPWCRAAAAIQIAPAVLRWLEDGGSRCGGGSRPCPNGLFRILAPRS